MAKRAHRSNMPDLYGVLGVAADASRGEIGRAYRRKAHGSHPDAQPQDPGASARFRDLTRAYEVLSDPARRAEYDRRRARTRCGTGAGQHPADDIPGAAKSRPRDRDDGPRGPWIPRVRPAQPAPVTPAAAGPSGTPLIWAGPVHIEPSSSPPGTPPDRTGLGDLDGLLGGYLDAEWDWPW